MTKAGDNDAIETARIYALGDADLVSAFANNGGVDQIFGLAAILATIEGENEGAAWHWLLAFFDGRYAYASGSCDYTGWDCQSGAEIYFGETQDSTLALSPNDVRRVFEDMLSKGEYTRPNTGGL